MLWYAAGLAGTLAVRNVAANIAAGQHRHGVPGIVLRGTIARLRRASIWRAGRVAAHERQDRKVDPG